MHVARCLCYCDTLAGSGFHSKDFVLRDEIHCAAVFHDFDVFLLSVVLFRIPILTALVLLQDRLKTDTRTVTMSSGKSSAMHRAV